MFPQEDSGAPHRSLCVFHLHFHRSIRLSRYASQQGFVSYSRIAVSHAFLSDASSKNRTTARVYSLELTEIKKLSEKGDSNIETDYHADSIDNIRRKHDKVKQFAEKNPGNLFQQGGVIYRGAAQFGTYFDQNYRAAFRITDSYRNRSPVRL